MSGDVLQQLHDELGYTPELEQELQRIQGYWKSLQILKQKATTSKSALARYRSYLERGLQSAREDLMDGDEIATAAREYWEFFDEQRKQFRIVERQTRRQPQEFAAWVEKWLPDVWRDYLEAFNSVVDRPCRTGFDRLRQRTMLMFKAYAGDDK